MYHVTFTIQTAIEDISFTTCTTGSYLGALKVDNGLSPDGVVSSVRLNSYVTGNHVLLKGDVGSKQLPVERLHPQRDNVDIGAEFVEDGLGAVGELPVAGGHLPVDVGQVQMRQFALCQRAVDEALQQLTQIRSNVVDA